MTCQLLNMQFGCSQFAFDLGNGKLVEPAQVVNSSGPVKETRLRHMWVPWIAVALSRL